jgi:hypothetical protein
MLKTKNIGKIGQHVIIKRIKNKNWSEEKA